MSTHQQLLYHIVFSTKHRKPTLIDGFRGDVWAYMAGIISNLGGVALKVGGFYDHAHLLIRIPAKFSVSDFVGQLKANTSKHINEESETISKFSWQDGFGAFTVSVSQKDRIHRYIERQMEYHQKITFENEYLNLLKKHEIDFDLKYIWE